nr:hypothetical protein [Elizabethkingia anophelis]
MCCLARFRKSKERNCKTSLPPLSTGKKWELKGEVNNVCFPTGALVENDILYIYYGAADQRIAVVSVKLSELIKELLQYSSL